MANVAVDLPTAIIDSVGVVPLRQTDASSLVASPPVSARISARRVRLVTTFGMVMDVLAIAVSYFVTWAIYLDPRTLAPGQALSQPGRSILLSVPIWIIVFAAFDLYDRRALDAPSEEVRRLLRAVSVSVLMVVMASFWLQIPVSRERIILLWLTSLGCVGATRFVVRRGIHRLVESGFVATPALVVGTNKEARDIARLLCRRRWLGYRMVGFIAVDDACPATVDGRPVVGSINGIADVVRQTAASAVIVAGSAMRPETLTELDQSLLPLGVDVRVSPGLPHMSSSRVKVRSLDGLALIALDRRPFSRFQGIVKRTLDLLAATVFLILAAPMMAVIAVVVRLGSRGPVLFRQQRVGKDGRLYVIYKFRSMVVDAEERLGDLREVNGADGVLFKLHHDPRVTRIGGVLRKWGLDELPQLFNVLKGEMSIVGPRPALPSETARYSDEVSNRLRVKPGLTGLWQVNGRHDLEFEEYVRYDLFYVQNWSLALDLYVILKTIPALLSRQGAY
jgi:exopolysaccharide biosynthesis polyprenyl glycosylphosphotransferase